MEKNTQEKQIKRSPVVTVVGHIDHGKSTLLDYIRKSNTAEKEAGGITQHISAYEVKHITQAGDERKITFLDTPGHEAFKTQRAHGLNIADLAILIVAADDGVKEQTKESLESVRQSGIPFIVAINKTDKEGANVERVKQELMEQEVFLEGYGGQTSCVPISAKKGEGIPELLEMIVLAADLEELQGNPEKNAEGVVLESNIDPKKGVSATLIIKDGTLKQGMYVVAGSSCSPVRIMEDFTGSQIKEASFSSPVKIIGFNNIPKVATPFFSFEKKKEAENEAAKTEQRENRSKNSQTAPFSNKAEKLLVPLIIKADVSGSLDAIENQIEKISKQDEDIEIKVIQKGIGSISENDVRVAECSENAIIIGFGVEANNKALETVEENGKQIKIKTSNIIYEIIDWILETIQEKRPKKEIEEKTGKVKIKKTFAQTKENQVLGGIVQEGYIKKGCEVKIHRRDLELGEGIITNLQQQKMDTEQVKEENECGMQVKSKVDISPGDVLEGFIRIQK